MDGEYEQWFQTRPKLIKEMIIARPPWLTYTMDDGSTDTYQVYSYSEDGTMTVTRYLDGKVPIWSVFGVHPQSLRPLLPLS